MRTGWGCSRFSYRRIFRAVESCTVEIEPEKQKPDEPIRHGQYLNMIRKEIRDDVTSKGKDPIACRAAAAKFFGTGNCMEQACMAMVFLSQRGVPCTLVKVTMPDASDHHVFVLTAALTGVTDLANDGGTPVCDPWIHEKAVVESGPHGFGAGVSTAVKHAAVLKALNFGTDMEYLAYWPNWPGPADQAVAHGSASSSSSSSLSLSSSPSSTASASAASVASS